MHSSLFPDSTPSPSGWFTAHCDGGSRGNPGPAGYGAVIEDPQGRIAARLSEFLGIHTNNYAEYKGLLAVLTWAGQNDARQLRVVSDSELMVKQMKGQYKVASPVLRPLWEEARRLARSLEKFEISHTLRGGNKEADRLANEAMDKGMGRQVGGRPESGTSNPSSVNRLSSPLAKPNASSTALEGYVKDGVVHLLEGHLPDGTFVKVIRK
ncbi:ribonuclease HI family protein [Occallatibacter savannae]|uniref:ribonuclease HI family protein n=1 Tax=Occallatibacter savannae TaxID=1002691 RepID=UPI000D6881A3|nr:ribonuclease HI family protein [Occallatibacter savannae]